MAAHDAAGSGMHGAPLHSHSSGTPHGHGVPSTYQPPYQPSHPSHPSHSGMPSHNSHFNSHASNLSQPSAPSAHATSFVRSSLDDLNPNKIFDKMGGDPGSTDVDDLEHAFFEKFERRNWTLHLFPNSGRWGIRINPFSFLVSVLAIWGFAVRLCAGASPVGSPCMLHRTWAPHASACMHSVHARPRLPLCWHTPPRWRLRRALAAGRRSGAHASACMHRVPSPRLARCMHAPCAQPAPPSLHAPHQPSRWHRALRGGTLPARRLHMHAASAPHAACRERAW